MAEDGSLAIIDSPAPFSTSKNERAVCLYSAFGRPAGQFALPDHGELKNLAYDGKRVLVAGSKEVVAYSVAGKPLWRFLPPHAKEIKPFWQPFLIRRGQELVLYDGHHTIYRYALPQ